MYSDQQIAELDDIVWRHLEPIASDVFAIRGASGQAPRPPEFKGWGLWKIEGSWRALISYWHYLQVRRRSGAPDPQSIKKANNLKKAALEWSAKFTIKFLKNVRAIVCSGPMKKTASKGAITGVATGLAVWITQEFGIENPLAIAIAALVIHVIGIAGKGAFCEMTEDEVIGEIRRKYGV